MKLDGSIAAVVTGGASGLPVTFASTTPAVCTTGGANGARVTMVSAGTCAITASQAGNANYAPAEDVARDVDEDLYGGFLGSNDRALLRKWGVRNTIPLWEGRRASDRDERFRLFRRIVFPLIAPGVISGGLFAFATSFDEVVVTLFLAGPEQATLPRQMFSGIRENLSPTIAAAATLLIGFSIVLLLTLEWLRGRSEKMRTSASHE